MKKRSLALLLALLLLLSCLTGCSGKGESNYASAENWAFLETDMTDTAADVFFIAPTVYLGDESHFCWASYDEETKPKFIGATMMEKGIYEENTRFFAPYYHQASLTAIDLPDGGTKYFDGAYQDVKKAFKYYLKHYNQGRPIILAGFSQGGDMCIRLLKDCFSDAKTQKLLVACYAIGWGITEEEVRANPHIKMAQGADDTGVLITFNSEAESVTDSPIIPAGMHTLGINPLNWKTGSTPADRELNLGACFTDYSGGVTSEIPELTGAYLDPERGTLRVTDVTPAEYPGVLFADGVYHIYDYQFFYRNLQENVQLRLEAYLSQN